MWLRDYHFDGLRIDAVHAIFDHSAVHILEQLAAEVADLAALTGRHLALAESDLNDPRVVQSPAIGGYGIHAQWSDDLHHALLGNPAQPKSVRVARVFSSAAVAFVDSSADFSVRFQLGERCSVSLSPRRKRSVCEHQEPWPTRLVCSQVVFVIV
jgi:hypothetical protein